VKESNMALFTIVEWVIKNLKQDPTYQLDRTLAGLVLWQLLHYRGVALLRGVWRSIRLRPQGGKLFLGKAVSLRHPQFLSVGRSVIIEDYVMIDALSHEGVILGNNVTIARGVIIQCTGVIRSLGVGLRIGDNSAVGAYSFLGAQGGIVIGCNVIMGPRVNFHAENHRYERADVPIRMQGESRQGIVVDDDCWIGAGSIILDGVHIGKGCVVAAGSVVTKSVPPYSVVAGVPARIVRQRPLPGQSETQTKEGQY
jgi:acetyltransferase-like isoleucine patch superfamily enzyme